MNLDLTSDINSEYASEMRYGEVDKFVVIVHWVSFGLLILLTILSSVVKISTRFYESPLSWRDISPTEALVALGIGFAAAIIPTLLRGKMKNHYLWRLLVALTITMFSYLFVFVSGGSIEMHFTFFVIITLMAVYSDWRLGWLMLVAVGLHHGILNYVAPYWVYSYGKNDMAVIAHAIPVLALVIFTTVLCRNNRNVIRDLVAIRTGLVGTIEEREKELTASKKA